MFPVPTRVTSKIIKAQSNERVNQRAKEILAERKAAKAPTSAQLSIETDEKPAIKPIEKPKELEEVILSSQEVYTPPKVVEEKPKERQLIKIEKGPRGRPKKEKQTQELKTIDDVPIETLNKPMKVMKAERAVPSESCHAVTNSGTRCKNVMYENLLCKLHYRLKCNKPIEAKTVQAIPLVKNINNELNELVLQEVTPLAEPNSSA